MKYTVKIQVVTLDMTKEHKAIMANYMAVNPTNLAFLVTQIVSGFEPIEEIKGRELKTLLGIEEQREIIFDQYSPLENRRAAIEQANNVSREYFDLLTFHSPGEIQTLLLTGQEGVFPLFNAFVLAEINGQQKVIARITEADIKMVENWMEEYEHYKKNGYDIGAGEPFSTISPFFDREVKILPDAGAIWSINQSVN